MRRWSSMQVRAMPGELLSALQWIAVPQQCNALRESAAVPPPNCKEGMDIAVEADALSPQQHACDGVTQAPHGAAWAGPGGADSRLPARPA